MKGARFHVFWALCIPLLFLLIFFSTLLFSVPDRYHHELLFSTYDFIIVAKSRRRLAAFFLFNVLIIITVFVGSPKAPDHQDHVPPVQLITSPSALEHDIHVKDEGNNDSYDGSSGVEDHDQYHGYDGYDEENDDDLDTEDDEDSEEDEKDNDLERRIEEFIAMVNRKWREELLTDQRLLCITAS
ncbi:hypothetical protein PTKIN_Ptkin12aG0198400 [Pterospermum kingtungense]